MTLDWPALWPRIHRAARSASRRLPACVDYRDLAQAGAERVLRSLPRYEAVPGVATEDWAVLTAINGMRDYVRAEARRNTPNPVAADEFDAPSDYSLEDDVITRETGKALLRAIAGLKYPLDREVARLVLYCGMDPTEAVAGVGAGLSTDRARVSRRMSRIRTSLQEAMKEYR